MMRRRAALLALLALAPAARGQSADPEADPDMPARPGAPVYGDALAERFLACMRDEGATPSVDDRAALADIVVVLGPSIARSLGGEGCDDSPAAQRLCADRVRELPCDELAARVGAGASNAPAAPPWAAGHAHTVALRVRACAEAERDGGALDDAERRVLAEFESGLATALGAMQATGACVVDENQLPACARSVASVGCEGLGARLGDDPGALARTVTPACAAMVRCGAAALEDGGADDGGHDDAGVLFEDAP